MRKTGKSKLTFKSNSCFEDHKIFTEIILYTFSLLLKNIKKTQNEDI